MKVLHAITGLSVGGAENMLAKLIEEASTRQSAYDPSVLSLMTPGDISQRILNCRVPLDTLGMHQGLPGPRDRRSAVSGKSGSVSEDLGGRRVITTQNKNT